MDSSFALTVAADALLFTHVLFVCFVVIGLLLILIGKPMQWTWVRNPKFRLAHLAAIAVVVIQSWAGVVCPLTTWEMVLRERAGDVTYTGTFMSHWLQTLLYYEAPAWVFIVCYTAFAGVVVISWFWVRPRPFNS